MRRFFKWVGIIAGGIVGLLVAAFAVLVIVDLMNHPNRGVELVQTFPAPGATPVDLVTGRKEDDGKVTGWRLYIREKGKSGLPRNALVSYDQDIAPRVTWTSPDEANICIDLKQGTIHFKLVDSMSTSSSGGGGRWEGKLNNVRYLVNHNC
jgi:hypothetical protein